MTTPDLITDGGGAPQPHPPAPRHRRRRWIAAAALLGACIGAGATASALHGQRATIIALTPAPIDAMKAWSPVAVKGEVAGIYGNKFIIQDATGKALVDTGREGEDATLVAGAETVTVQGRFEHGVIHAVAIAHADGHSDVLGPPPPHGPDPLAWMPHPFRHPPG